MMVTMGMAATLVISVMLPVAVIMMAIARAIIMDIKLSWIGIAVSVVARMFEAVGSNAFFNGSIIGFNYQLVV